ncbi:multidrug effflux MFS transporter [Arhodomonas aquaeolei]|nr:multidrug effflux MFS transporter [Arhodomonas aquaeolei]
MAAFAQLDAQNPGQAFHRINERNSLRHPINPVWSNNITAFIVVNMPDTPSKPTTAAPAAHKGWYVLAILSLLMGFASISTDLYLPAMPAIADALGAGDGTIELTVSGYLVGFSLTQLIWGPVSDRFGRRVPVAIGLILFVIGSAGCALSDSAAIMIAWRVVQAIGACASVALSRAMVRDLYDGNRAAQMMSTLMTIMAIAPLLGPLVGAQIAAFAGWRAIFWTLVGIGAIALLLLLTLPETHAPKHRSRETFAQALRRYGELIRHRHLLGYVGVGGCFYGGMFAYIAGTPFAYIDYYGVPDRLYGFLFGAGVIGIMTTNLVNARLVRYFGVNRMLLAGSLAAFGCAAVTGVNATTGWGGLWGIAVPLFAFVSTTGFIIANAMAGALEDFPRRAGAVSALVGATQYGSGVVGSALVGLLADGTPQPLGLVVAMAATGTLVSSGYVVLIHRRAR